MKTEKTKATYYVANYQGTLAGHDLDLAHAREVLRKQLELDPRNSQEWEILKDSENLYNN